ncbi:MAG: TraR/DksA C4-type zinc finger protein [Pseudomonadota bacterium]
MLTLSDDQLQTLQQLLDSQEQDAQTEIRAETRHRLEEPYSDLAGEVADPGDNSVADLIIDVENARLDRQATVVNDIDAARERIKDGSYGICFDCEEDIDYERLLVAPTALRCIRCQEAYERTFASAAAPRATL